MRPLPPQSEERTLLQKYRLRGSWGRVWGCSCRGSLCGKTVRDPTGLVEARNIWRRISLFIYFSGLGKNIKKEIDITLEQAFSGLTISVPMERVVFLPDTYLACGSLKLFAAFASELPNFQVQSLFRSRKSQCTAHEPWLNSASDVSVPGVLWAGLRHEVVPAANGRAEDCVGNSSSRKQTGLPSCSEG